MKITHPKKPSSLFFIKKEKWDELLIKEKDLLILLYSKKYTKQEICRKLYIDTDQGFRYLCGKVREKIK